MFLNSSYNCPMWLQWHTWTTWGQGALIFKPPTLTRTAEMITVLGEPQIIK